MTSTYPNFAGKHDHEAFFTPTDFVNYLRASGRLGDLVVPNALVLCYQRGLYEHILRTEGVGAAAKGTHRGLVTLPSTDHQVGVIGAFGIGAPAAAGGLEDFIALGARRFMSIGTAGSLQASCPVGHTIVCDRAIRDEGVSHHYVAPAKWSVPSSRLTAKLSDALTEREISHTTGGSWTIDTPYRETVAEARHYQAEGILCVEMEAAALFAVAAYRSVEIAAAFVVSDSLADLVWDPQFHSVETFEALERLYQAAVATLVE